MDNEKTKALEHVDNIKAGLAAVHAIANAGTDVTLIQAVDDLHQRLADARSDYLTARGWDGENDSPAFSGGEEKPPKPPEPPESGG